MNFADRFANNKMFMKGREVINLIENEGYLAFFVGGCVRDLILDLEPKDVDITTNAPMEVLESLFDCHDIGKSKDFGIVTVNLGGYSFEVAQFRKDGEYKDGRRPESVEITGSLEDDVLRRDFTINALAMDNDGGVIDFVGGLEDLKYGIIRCVGDPVERFQEDFLRMLRAVRFASRFAFDLENSTFAAIRSLRANVAVMAKERVRDELIKMADCDGEQFADAILLLDKCRLLEVILPEVKQLQDVQEEPRFHPEAYELGNGTTFDHTIAALNQNIEKDPIVNLSVLFHDLGKGVTHELRKGRYAEYRHRFHNHGLEGMRLVEKLCDRLKFPSKDTEIFKFCANNHMALLHCKEMRKSTAAKLATHEFYPYLRDVMFCDDSCRLERFNPEKFSENMRIIDEIGKEFKEFHSKNKVKLVGGKEVMEITGLNPGPKVGAIIETTTERFLDSSEFVCLRKLILEVYNELN